MRRSDSGTPAAVDVQHLFDRGKFAVAIIFCTLAVIACALETPVPANPPTSTSAPEDTQTQEPAATTDPLAGMTQALCVDVVDGDTIKVDIGGEVHTLRYIGIDAPETVHPEEPVQWMGPQASEANRQLVEGQTVYLEKDVSETDQYGRLLRYVYLEDGTFVNAELVRLGYALSATYQPDVKHQDQLVASQQEAREAERGLWGATPAPESQAVEPTPTPTSTPSPTAAPAPAATPAPTQPPATTDPAAATQPAVPTGLPIPEGLPLPEFPSAP